MAAEPYIPVTEAAQYLGVAVATLNKWRCKGTGPHYCKVNGKAMYTVAAIDEFAQRGLVTPETHYNPANRARALASRFMSSKCGNFVYFIRTEDDQFVKIGVSRESQIQYRVREIQTGCPLRLELIASIPGGFQLERRLHEAFADYRTTGEWFRIEGPVRIFMEGLLDQA